MRVLSCDAVHQAEREAISRSGGSALVLMQRAGYAVMQFCLANFKFNSACVVCGTGTNGGRGLAAAQCLKAVAADLSVIILAKDASELCPDAATMLSNLAVSVALVVVFGLRRQALAVLLDSPTWIVIINTSDL